MLKADTLLVKKYLPKATQNPITVWRCLLIILLLNLLAGCSLSEIKAPKPWVKPYQRHNLADPLMNGDRDPVATTYMHHVYQAREGARGAEGGAGGGCGCN